MSDYLKLADVVGVFGIKGWLKIKSYLEEPTILAELQGIELAPGPDMRPEPPRVVEVDAIQRQGKGLAVHLKGLDDRSDAEILRGFVLRIPADRFPEAGDNEFYWRDLVGMRVWCREGDATVLLGRVHHLLDTGSNDVLVVRPCEDSLDDRERLIPWLLDEVVTRVDRTENGIWVDWYVDL